MHSLNPTNLSNNQTSSIYIDDGDGHAYSHIEVHLLAPVLSVEIDICIIFTFHFNWKHLHFQSLLKFPFGRNVLCVCVDSLILQAIEPE